VGLLGTSREINRRAVPRFFCHKNAVPITKGDQNMSNQLFLKSNQAHCSKLDFKRQQAKRATVSGWAGRHLTSRAHGCDIKLQSREKGG
jgi:hypothetical protein